MKTPSLDGASIKKFFLYHCEKLILVLSVALLGLFFWFGYSTPTFEESTPSKMVDKAKQARRRMVDPEAWTKISSLRQGDDEVVDRIEQVPDVLASSFASGPASYPVKRDELRRDFAMSESPFKQDFTLRPFVASILIQQKGRIRVEDPLAMFEFVQPVVEKDESSMKTSMGGMMGGMMGGSGPFSGSSGPPRGGDDEDDEKDGMMGGMSMGGMMGGMGSGDKGSSKKSRKKKKEEVVEAGTYVSQAVAYSTKGLRQTFDPTTVKSYNLTGVAVTGLVDHKKMWKSFNGMYGSSFGFHPDRDTPRYDYVQVQRRVVDDDGSTSDWTDLSKQLADQPDLFPTNLTTAPEVVSAPEHDGILTMPIPPLAGIDYTDLAVHPSLKPREFETPKVIKEEMAGDKNPMMKGEDKEKSSKSGRRRRSAFGSKGGRGMMGGMMGGMGMSNAPSGDDEDEDSRAPSMGGMGGMGVPGMGGMAGSSGGRTAADLTAYTSIDIRKEPASDYKVVRFFDIHGVKANTTYQYRVRVWLRDPNNEDPELKNDISGGGDAGMGGMGMGMGMGMGRKGKKGDDDEDEDESIRFAKKTPIANSMIHPKSRERLNRAREKDGVYYVSEQRKNAAGELEWVEIQVPENQDYLRFARPSAWSENLEVTVDASPSFVYAGEPVEARRVEVSPRGSVMDGEPSMKIATGKRMQLGEDLAGVTIPFKTEVKAGDLLDFDQAAHVLHPVTRQIHRVTDVEVVTNGVILDVADGEEIKTRKSSPISYYYPGEVLVMNANGKIELRSDLEDRGDYIAASLEKDEKASYGGRRKRKSKAEENPFGMGMGGMGMGGMGSTKKGGR